MSFLFGANAVGKNGSLVRLAASVLITIGCVCVAACSDQSSGALQATASNTVFAANAININTANLEELQRIPHVGGKLAARIIEHREVHGAFRRVEHLMLIQGISDKRFRKIRPLVRVE